jgi:oxygen-independent coproporphyrinogen-3 oxidase
MGQQLGLAAPQSKNPFDELPSSAYVHVPFCRRRCFYCDFPISVLGNKTDINTSAMIAEYVQALCQEIRLTPEPATPLKTVFFGGGTPSLLPEGALEAILHTLEQKFGISREAEISMEMDPGTFTRSQLRGYLNAGVNRVSLGVQSFDAQLLQQCGRAHNQADIFTALELIKELGVTNLSMDLIAGLPHQTLSQWENSLKTSLEIAPNHLSCYDLVLEPVTAFGKRYQPGEHPLPTDEIAAAMYRLAQQTLTLGGYRHYEISNYAQPGCECRHNRVYWENRPYYGFGMGAASYVAGKRFTRPRTRPEDYAWVMQLRETQGMIDTPALSCQDYLLETLMLGLRLAEGVNLSLLRARLGKEVLKSIWQGLQPYIRRRWVEGKDQQGHLVIPREYQEFAALNSINLTDPEGFLFSNTILAALFEKLT